VKPSKLHPHARAELIEAVAYYEQQSPGLGEGLYDEIRRMTAAIEQAPHQYPSGRHGSRRILGRRFPYSLVYIERPDCVYIVAVAHAKRRPDYWQARV
jgi:toxin ParE1/3/4